MVTFMLTKGSVTLHYDGKTKVIASGDGRFEKVLSAIRENRLSAIPSIADNEAFFQKQGLELQDGILKLGNEEMPIELSDRIMAYKEENLPITSLLSFWENLRKNPSFNSRKQLFRFLENKGHSLTEDGCFIGYRGVTEDFKDKHTGKFDNSPGKICEIPREQVDDNPDNTCSYGLHVGGYQYAKEFGPKLVLVKVNPKDVVAVPNDYNGQKMRVCRFEVIKETTDMLDGVVFGDVKPLDDDANHEFAKAGEESDECGWLSITSNDFDHENDDAYERSLEPYYHDFEAEEVEETKVIERAFKKRYANNHAVRGPDGKFIARKKKKGNKNARKS
jgi:hypothetical protein